MFSEEEIREILTLARTCLKVERIGGTGKVNDYKNANYYIEIAKVMIQYNIQAPSWEHQKEE